MSNLSQAAMDAVSDFRQYVPDCVSAGVIDLSSGLLLAHDTPDSHPRVVLDMLASVTADLFQGRGVAMIEEMFNRHRGIANDRHHYFREILVNSDNLWHLFLRSRPLPDIVGVVVSRQTAEVGRLLEASRAVMGNFAAAAS